MSLPALTPAMRQVIAYFGELGPRWGIDGDAARIHVLLYLAARPMTAAEVAAALGLEAEAVAGAFRFLREGAMIDPPSGGLWRVEGDPWSLLMAALEERRRRELPLAVATLGAARRAAAADPATPQATTERLTGLLGLVEDIAALEVQARRLSPKTLRRAIGIGGRLARLLSPR